MSVTHKIVIINPNKSSLHFSELPFLFIANDRREWSLVGGAQKFEIRYKIIWDKIDTKCIPLPVPGLEYLGGNQTWAYATYHMGKTQLAFMQVSNPTLLPYSEMERMGLGCTLSFLLPARSSKYCTRLSSLQTRHWSTHWWVRNKGRFKNEGRRS